MIDTTHPTHNGDDVATSVQIILYDGYTVSGTFYTAIRAQVEEVIPVLECGEKYTLEMLCGETFWHLLNSGERRMAGRCMAHMVVKGLLPLRFAETKHEYPKRYQLR